MALVIEVKVNAWQMPLQLFLKFLLKVCPIISPLIVFEEYLGIFGCPELAF